MRDFFTFLSSPLGNETFTTDTDRPGGTAATLRDSRDVVCDEASVLVLDEPADEPDMMDR